MLAWASEVEAAMNTATCGAVGGPRYQVDRVSANSTLTYNLQFRVNQLAEVIVSGDGDTDLDLYINDPYGALVGYDEYWTPVCFMKSDLKTRR